MKKISFLIFVLILSAPSSIFARTSFMLQHYELLNEADGNSKGDNLLTYSYKKDENKNARWTSKIDATARYYTTSSKIALSAPEFYLKYRNGRSVLTIGRKKLGWAANEKFWALGHLDSNRNFSLLESNQEGHTGLHWERKYKSFKINVFGSAVHIPQLNPGLSAKDGQIIGANQWAQLPPTHASFNGVLVPIHYTLDTPEIGEIALKESLGTRMEYNWNSGSVSVYGIYKAENQLRINATGKFNQEQGRANILARPFANHTLVYGANVKQKVGNNVELSSGFMSVNPRVGNDPSFEFAGVKIEPVYIKEHYLTASATYRSNSLTASANLIELLNKPAPNTNVFAKKPRWHRAVGFNARYDLNDRFYLMGDLKFDILMKDVVVTAEAGYAVSQNLVLALGMEVIDSPLAESFWSLYRTNDSVYTNLLYKF